MNEHEQTISSDYSPTSAASPQNWEDPDPRSVAPIAKRVTAVVRQKFTEAETNRHVAEMAVAIAEAGKLEIASDLASDAAKEAKKKHSAAEARWKQLSKDLAAGEGDIEVEAEEIEEFATNSVVTRRLDNGEEICRRAMTAAERQPTLFAHDAEGHIVDRSTGEYVGDDESPETEDAPESDDESPESDGLSVSDPEAVLAGEAPASKPAKRARRTKASS